MKLTPNNLQTVLFSFLANVSEARRTELITQIRQWKGVTKVSTLPKTAVVKTPRHHWYLTLNDPSRIEQVIRQLRRKKEIDCADFPNQRWLTGQGSACRTG